MRRTWRSNTILPRRQQWPQIAVIPISLGLLLVVFLPLDMRILTAQWAAYARGPRTSASSRRAAVVDRMYSDALALDYIRSLNLLDPEVRRPCFCAAPLLSGDSLEDLLSW